MKLTKVIFALGIAVQGFCFVEVPINESKPLKVVFSENAFNRIETKNGTIEEIFSVDGDYFEVYLSGDQKQARIICKKPISKENQKAISIRTSFGKTQDILVISDPDKELEVVQLVGEEEVTKEIKALLSISNSHKKTIEFIQSAKRAETPKGYARSLIHPKEGFSVHSFTFCPVDAYENSSERVVHFKIKNKANKRKSLDEKLIERSKDRWVYIGKNELKPKETTYCFISTPKD